MINQKRVRRMARMAAYEERLGASDRKIMSYFRGDYLTRQVLITFFCSTLAFLLLALMTAVYYFETLIVEIYTMDLRVLVIRILTGYLIFVGCMIVITLMVYNHRYSRARRRASAYYQDLNGLSMAYRQEND